MWGSLKSLPPWGSVFDRSLNLHVTRKHNIPSKDRTGKGKAVAVQEVIGGISNTDFTSQSEECLKLEDVSNISTDLDYDGLIIDAFAEIKVQKLCSSVGLPSMDVSTFRSSTDRFYGLSPKSDPPEKYLVHAPKTLDDSYDAFTDEVSLTSQLKHVLPIPLVVAYDVTSHNPLGAPLMLFKCPSVIPLSSVYLDMSCEDQCVIAVQIAELLGTMNLIHFETVGRIESTKATIASKDNFSLDVVNMSIFQTTNWHYIDDEYPVPEDPTPHKHHNLKKFFLWFHEINLKDLCEKLEETHDKLCEIYNGSSDQRKNLFEDLTQTCDEAQKAYAQAFMIHRRLVDLIEEMDAISMFRPENVIPVLVRRSFTPQDILVDAVDGAWKVTSIINWTFCDTLPEVLAHEPPTWLWNTSINTPDGFTAWYNGDERAEMEEGSEEQYDEGYGSEQEMDTEQIDMEQINHLFNSFADQPAEETPEVAQNDDGPMEEGPSNAQDTSDSASISPGHPPDSTPQDDNAIVKAHFDEAIEKHVPGYLEDAYGKGKWSRELWTHTGRPLNIGFYAEQCEDFIAEWEDFNEIPEECRWQRLQFVEPPWQPPSEIEDEVEDENEEADADPDPDPDPDTSEDSEEVDEKAQAHKLKADPERNRGQDGPQAMDQASGDTTHDEEKGMARGTDENVYEGEDDDIFMD